MKGSRQVGGREAGVVMGGKVVLTLVMIVRVTMGEGGEGGGAVGCVGDDEVGVFRWCWRGGW